VRLSGSNDARVFLAGVTASLALVAYLAVAFANTHATNAPTGPGFSPFTAYHSKLVRIPRNKGRGYAARVTQAAPGSYGVLVPTLLSNPVSRGTYLVGVWLKGAGSGRIGISIDEFRPGATSVYVVERTVPPTATWHHYRFLAKVRGSWLGLGMYVFRQTKGAARTWFAVRDLTVALRRR
jgi:hypothetical protein